MNSKRFRDLKKMSRKCKEHIVAKLSHQQRQKKNSNFLLQKFKSATCRTNLEVPGTTQRDGMGREEGGGFRMGNTCIPVADSF